MLTRTVQAPGANKKLDPKEILKGLPGMTDEFIEDFMLGIEFGAFKDRTHIIWKHGSPWLYPPDEFQMLKTGVRAFGLASEMSLVKSRIPKIEMPEGEKQKGIKRERAYQEYLNRKAS